MKQLRLLFTATACMLAILLVLGNVAQLGSVVVCIGINGHVDIESLLEGCCVSVTSGGGSDKAEVAAINSTCGDCTDVQVMASALKTDETRWSQPNPDDGCIGCRACFGVGGTARLADAINMDQHSRSLSPLSTVILLT